MIGTDAATRHSLIARMKNSQDEASWREFFESYWELICNFARKAGLTNAEAEDVVQETIIGISRNISSFKTGAQHGSFRTWLLNQTRWRIVDQFRKRGRLVQMTAAPGTECPPAQNLDEQTGTAPWHRLPDPATLDSDAVWKTEWENHVLATALERIKAKVSVKQFQVFDLHALQGLSARETAALLGTTTMAVHMTTSRLRRLLRTELAKLERV